MSVLDFFPFEKPYKSQEAVIEACQEAFKDYRYVILESPVGSGKSAIALTLARQAGKAHVLIPRKSLQDQYFADFEQFVTLMKGRSSYLCGFEMPEDDLNVLFTEIRNGRPTPPTWGQRTCAEGPCKNNESTYDACMERIQICPYSAALGYAQGHNLVIHNFWSFIYQGHFSGRFDQRPLLVVDEAHMMEDILRDFTKRSLSVPGEIPVEETRDLTTSSDWVDWFLERKDLHPKEEEAKEKFLAALDSLASLDLSTAVSEREYREDGNFTRFSFTPKSLGNVPENLVFQYGEKVLLMSGTIYDKARFCRTLGIPQEEACFIRAPSSFPKETRPIYAKPEYMVDLSHRCWQENLEEMGEKLRGILEVFHDVKGLIHAPSYRAVLDIMRAVRSDRLWGHDKHNFGDILEEFYASEGNGVLVSPTCQQGVDFKQNRARFQVILRVPYPNVGDEFTKVKMKEDFPWYNYQTLLTFGQQLGRVNRAPDDFGATILMDERFPKFIRRNSKYLPKWQTDAIIWR